MSDQTPFEKWWVESGNHLPFREDELTHEIARRMAHEAWIAALEFAAELMREEEKSE